MQQMLHRGFTLIELLVVIAIIGILAAVVLTSLGGAQEGAQNSNVQQAMSSVRSAAQLSYNASQFSYENVCSDTEVNSVMMGLSDSLAFINGTSTSQAAAVTGAPPSSRPVACNGGPTAYAVSAPLLEDGSVGNAFWCVDSTGFQGRVTTDLAATITVCPGS